MGVVKAVLVRKFRAKQAYLGKLEKHEINKLTLHIKQLTFSLEKEQTPKLIEKKS